MIARVLTDEQIDKVHGASLEILERVGVVVPHEELLGRFADAGARVERHSSRVRIAPELVMDSVANSGKRFTIYGRDTSLKASFGEGTRNYNSIAGEAHWVDEPGGARRYATLEDVATGSRFADALEQVNIVGAMADPHDLPAEWRSVAVAAAQIRNTTKPVTFWFHDRGSAKFICEILVALRGDEKRASALPLCYPLLEPISPLRFPFDGVDLLFETSRLSLPVHIGPMAQMGLSAPATVAGTMAQENAEILAGVCITQLVRPGLPVCYGGICHAFDMRTTQLIFAGPEQAIFGVAMTQMGKRYGLPVYINVGLTDSKRPDAQAGLESGVTLALGAAAGADVFGHMGISGVDQASSLDMLVLQDEVISYVESTMREIDFSDAAFGLGEIADAALGSSSPRSTSAGPGGSFIDRVHTAEHFRKELWFPHLLDRDYYQSWLDLGAPSTEQRCRERRDEILRTHEIEPVAPELDRELDRIVASAKRELGEGT
jgi:trimethylamine--corrinoid protein Co-methyltransferase